MLAAFTADLGANHLTASILTARVAVVIAALNTLTARMTAAIIVR
jgi:hypothetical protein